MVELSRFVLLEWLLVVVPLVARGTTTIIG